MPEEIAAATKAEIEKIPDPANPVKRKRGRPPGSRSKQAAAPPAAAHGPAVKASKPEKKATTFSPLKAMTPQMLSMIARAPIHVADAGALAASKGKVHLAKYIHEPQMQQVDDAFLGLTGLVDFECTPLELYGYTCLMVVATGAMGALFDYARQYMPEEKMATPSPFLPEIKGSNHVEDRPEEFGHTAVVPQQSAGSESPTA